VTSGFAPFPYGDPLAAFAPFKDVPNAMLLHGAGAHPSARWSMVLPEPRKPCRIDRPCSASAARSALRAMLRPPLLRGAADDDEPPFSGGAAGLIAYEFGALLEPAAPLRQPVTTPFAALARHDTIVAFDHWTRRAFVRLSGSDAGRAAVQAIRQALESPPPAPPPAAGAAASTEPAGVYAENVDHVRERIGRGDLFQANISRAFEGALGVGDHPFALFQRLCGLGPAPFMAYLRLDDAAIVSQSPERLVRARRRGHVTEVESTPIKGTRPRAVDPAEDARLLNALLASEKDRAENLMIVDLMRNDLARVCARASVRVPRLFGLESFANVHHLVSTVTGTLAPGRDAVDLLAATFPAGSITGAPKIMAMTVIDALESAPRGASFGGLGWFGDDGAMDCNVAIRTATCTRDGPRWRLQFRVGGGITYDSDPVEETAETTFKAAALLAAATGALS